MNQQERTRIANGLFELAGLLSEDAAPTASRLLAEAAAAVVEPLEVRVVEQSTLTGTERVPDGWSWTDIGDPRLGGFTGNYSGVRLQKGEPILEQAGHFLFVRHAETSYTARQESMFRNLTELRYVDESGKAVAAITVLVVYGFRGLREGFTVFEPGREPRTEIGDDRAVTSWVKGWLDRANANPITSPFSYLVDRVAEGREETKLREAQMEIT